MITAHTPQVGIELAESSKPDLVLLDINLPGMDGYNILQIFKSKESMKDVSVIAVTANAMTHDIERGRNAGFDDYLVKPFNVAFFLETIDRFLKE